MKWDGETRDAWHPSVTSLDAYPHLRLDPHAVRGPPRIGRVRLPRPFNANLVAVLEEWTKVPFVIDIQQRKGFILGHARPADELRTLLARHRFAQDRLQK